MSKSVKFATLTMAFLAMAMASHAGTLNDLVAKNLKLSEECGELISQINNKVNSSCGKCRDIASSADNEFDALVAQVGSQAMQAVNNPRDHEAATVRFYGSYNSQLSGYIKKWSSIANRADGSLCGTCRTSKSNKWDVEFDASQTAELKKALAHSLAAIDTALGCLNTLRTNPASNTKARDAFIRYFGFPTRENIAIVAGNLKKIKESLLLKIQDPKKYFKNAEYDTGTKKGKMDRAYANLKTNEIFFMKHFFSGIVGLNDEGRWSTVIHEESHCTLKTWDYAGGYEKSHAVKLAKSDPAKAFQNASSYEFFMRDIVKACP